MENFTWKYITTLPRSTKEHFTFDYISRRFVLKELKVLKRQKAPRIDKLPPGLLKDCAYIIDSALAYIFNLSIKTSTVPSVWKITKITPVFKSGDSTKPENQSISTLPIALKTLEKAVHHNLITFLENKNLLTNCQCRFRSKQLTKLATTLFCDTIQKEISNEKLVGFVYIDLSKAFNTIRHSMLMEKLQTYGVDGDKLVWFNDYLFGQSQIVAMNNVKCNKEPIYCRVPQGSILGSLLFIVF